jgi:hypothetical protein
MPFTPAHAMAVLPGLRVRWLEPTCLVIGSMAPDFEYFVRGELVGRFGHTFVGMWIWGVPVTLALAVLFHGVVKWPLLVALPARATAVFGAPLFPRRGSATIAGRLAAMIAAAALGNATHLLWDGVTHSNGAIARRVAALGVSYDVPVLGDMAVHRIIQHASSVVGLIGVGWYLARRWRRARPAEVVAPRGRVRVVFAGAIAAGTAGLLYRLSRMHVDDPGSLIAGTISGVLAGSIVASLLTRAHGMRYRDAVARS